MFNPFRVRLPIPRVNVVKRSHLKPSLPSLPKPKRHRKHERLTNRPRRSL
jgi:hypothetical protein